jgi:hypothetical protein
MRDTTDQFVHFNFSSLHKFRHELVILHEQHCMKPIPVPVDIKSGRQHFSCGPNKNWKTEKLRAYEY